MFLDLNAVDSQMKLVYELVEDLKKNPERIRLVQALTLDSNRPRSGLKGSHGLFGSPEWWATIKSEFEKNDDFLAKVKRLIKKPIKTKIISGVIDETYFAGQDARWGDQVNSFVLKLEDGTTVTESIYPKLKSDRKLFRPGARVLIAYVFDEGKARKADGSATYSKTVLEMAVSTRPITT